MTLSRESPRADMRGGWPGVFAPVQLLWGNWLVVTLAWYACAVFTAAAIKQSSHRNMLSVFANLVIGWPLVAPFAAIGGCHRLALHWRKVLLIAILAGLEKNLTNSSLSHIGGALKTALHGLNVVFTFFVAAFAGADDRSKFCILGCQCRGNLLLALSVVLVASGSVIMAIFQDDQEGAWNSGMDGVLLQLGSGMAYALKFTAIKLLLGGSESESIQNAQRPPSKAQVAFLCNPVTGLMSLALVPLGKDWTLPPFGLSLAVAASATGILVFQLQLTQLTSPLTVAVLAIFHDVAIASAQVHWMSLRIGVAQVLWFLCADGETFSQAQQFGYAVSAVGAVIYSCAKLRYSSLAPEDNQSDIDSQVEQSFTMTPLSVRLH
ncbi:unnamed protein product [Effrenium voratum]|uniref:Uncharacterized protein n=1 Tax=Effrenium voratum TaxID=2562239 RepID=A0AA36HV03_9DINO|nr:unnamed protein product [Effrenium voratum]